MILGISRFRVANGMESDVKEAFFNRPHLVDSVPGFLGMETFTQQDDATIFHLVTRWTDVESFKSWHSSPAHHQSHKGIPKGLKLDPGFTEVVIMERLSKPDRAMAWEEVTADAASLISSFLQQTSHLHAWALTPEGSVRLVNQGAARKIGGTPESLVGRPLWPHLTESSAQCVRTRVANGARQPSERFHLEFLDLQRTPFALECQLDVQPDGFLLLGEAPRHPAAEAMPANHSATPS